MRTSFRLARRSMLSFPVIFLFVAGTALGTGDDYTVVKLENSGSIEGVVTYAGTPPKPEKLEVTKDRAVCGKTPKLDESLVVDPQSKGIKNVVISLREVSSGKEWSVPEEGISVDQHGCQFVPHVQVVPVKQPLFILNSDGILHNIHTYSTANPPVNRAQPKFLKRVKLTFEKPEIVKLTCDVHNWMKAWIVVAEHPYYAVTDDQGHFKLDGIPAGSYTLQLWHETLGEQTQSVVVKANETTKVTFTLKQ